MGRFLNAFTPPRTHQISIEYALWARIIRCYLVLRGMPFTSEEPPISMVRPHGNPLKYGRYPHFTVQSAEASGGEISCKRSDGY